MTDQQWRVLDGQGNDQGPYSFQDLQAYYQSGHITHETLVWTDGLADWTPAGQIAGLLPDAPLPVVPLAEAAPAPSYQPLGQPQVAGAVSALPQTNMPASPERKGAPAGLTYVTITIAVASLILFFFPWVSISMNLQPEKGDDLTKSITQTGFQSITADVSASDDFIEKTTNITAESFGLEGEEKEAFAAEFQKKLKEPDKTKKEFGISVLNLIALIAVGIGLVLAIVGMTTKISALVVSSQLLLAAGAALIGVQLAIQFPMIKDFVTEMDEKTKLAEASFAERKKQLEETSIDSPEAAAAINEETKRLNQMIQGNFYGTSVEPTCFVAVILLTGSVFLLVMTMSASSATPLITSQGGGFQMPSTGAQPQQQQSQGGFTLQ